MPPESCYSSKPSFLIQSPGFGNATPGSGSCGPSDEHHLKLLAEGARASDFCLRIVYQKVLAEEIVVDFFFRLDSTRWSSRCNLSRSAMRTSLFMALTLLLDDRTTETRSSGSAKVSLELRMSSMRVVGGTSRDPVEALRAIDRTDERCDVATDAEERTDGATEATSSSSGASSLACSVTFSSRERDCELSRGASKRDRLPVSSLSMTGSLRPYQLPAGTRIPGGRQSSGADARCAARLSCSAFHFWGGKVE